MSLRLSPQSADLSNMRSSGNVNSIDLQHMIRFPEAASALRPHRLYPHFDQHASDELRDYIERLRYAEPSHAVAIRKMAVISIHLDSTERNAGQVSYRELLVRRLDAHWAHDNAVGWLDRQRIGVVLPSATAIESLEFAKSLVSDELSPQRMVVYAMDAETLGRKARRCFAPLKLCPLELVYAAPPAMLKRTMDLAGAATLLIALSPIFLVIAVLIKFTSKGPIWFTQWRVGRGGKPFRIYKFRTMRHDAEDLKPTLLPLNEQDGLAFKITGDPRVTSLGYWLRRSSLDELPQLINVLRGEMSLVGPRPLPCSDWKPDGTWVCRRHDVLPGLTCTWQVSGRSEIRFEEWMRMDLEYIERHGTLLDLKLLVRTLPAVFNQRGAS